MSIWNRLFKRRPKDESVDELVRQRMCRTFMSLTTYNEQKQFLHEHPEMLDPFTEAFLLEMAERQRDASASEHIRSVAALLRRCRDVGIHAEFTNKNQPHSAPGEERLISVIQKLLNAPSLVATRRIIEEHPELLTDEADQIMQWVSDDRARDAIEPHRLLLLRCRAIGIPEAIEEEIQKKETKNVRIAEVVIPLLHMESVDEMLGYIRSHPDIVSQETINLLTAFIHQAEPEIRSHITHIRDLIIKIHCEGVEP